MQASQPGRLARRPSAAVHRPACGRGAQHPDRYIDVPDLRGCEIRFRYCRETDQHVAEATTAAAADFALGPSRIRSSKFAGIVRISSGLPTTNVAIEYQQRIAQA